MENDLFQPLLVLIYFGRYVMTKLTSLFETIQNLVTFNNTQGPSTKETLPNTPSRNDQSWACIDLQYVTISISSLRTK